MSDIKDEELMNFFVLKYENMVKDLKNEFNKKYKDKFKVEVRENRQAKYVEDFLIAECVKWRLRFLNEAM